METLADEIASGRSLALFKEYKTHILNTAKNIKSNDATFNISTLPQVTDKLVDLMTNYKEAIRKVEAAESAFISLKPEVNPRQELELASLEELYTSQVEALFQDSTLEEGAMYDLEAITAPSRDEEVVVEAPVERTWPKDPITKTNIKKAVRNSLCGHIYDRASIESYIDGRKANKQRIPCPVAGCQNENTEKRDLIPDDETNLLIESLKEKPS